MRVLGIDPGYDRFGIAVVEKTNGKEILLFSECVLTDKKADFGDRLHQISNRFEEIINKYKPDHISVEKLFFNTNKKTAGKVAEARGVILEKCASHNLPVSEFAPGQIKIATTGYGKSDKKQVIFMVSKLVSIEKEIKYDDEFDAIAVALTGLAHLRSNFDGY